MYQAIEKAHDHLANRDPSSSRVIIVLSDGADSRPQQLPTVNQLLAKVKPRNPDDEIRIITIGFLIDGEPHRRVLQSLADATNGQFFEVKNPEKGAKKDPSKDKDLRQVFKDIITLF
jgi:Mg-chelatase subunit ChlD